MRAPASCAARSCSVSNSVVCSEALAKDPMRDISDSDLRLAVAGAPADKIDYMRQVVDRSTGFAVLPAVNHHLTRGISDLRLAATAAPARRKSNNIRAWWWPDRSVLPARFDATTGTGDSDLCLAVTGAPARHDEQDNQVLKGKVASSGADQRPALILGWCAYTARYIIAGDGDSDLAARI